MWKRVGAEGADDIEVDGLAERIEREVGNTGSVLIHTMVAAWAAAPDVPDRYPVDGIGVASWKRFPSGSANVASHSCPEVSPPGW